MKNKVCASIITYNIDEKIIDVVNSIKNQVDYVVIIDNASNEKTVSILRQLENKDNINLILNTKNNGIAKALNQGLEFARNMNVEWLLTLDHDSICDEQMIKNMLNTKDRCFDSNEIAIVAPKVFEINKQDFISKRHKENEIYTYVKDCIQSGAMFKVNVFNEIGNFNEHLFIYHVDYEFCERVLKNNYRIIQCNNTILVHEEGYKIPKKFLGVKTFYNNYSSSAIYYITRNTVYMSKNYNIFYCKRIIKDFIYILAYDEKKVERISYWIRGLIDGIYGKLGKL